MTQRLVLVDEAVWDDIVAEFPDSVEDMDAKAVKLNLDMGFPVYVLNPFDDADLMAAVGLIPTTVQRGTDSALLAASYLGHQFTPYVYGPTSLAGAATFTPPADTIVMCAYLDVDQKLRIVNGGNTLKIESGMHAQERGYIGCIYCDGTNIGFKNGDGSAHDLTLYGVTLS